MSETRVAPHAPAPFESAAIAELTAVVLAGGLGTRLRPVVADRPKVLAPVGGRPFLFRVLDRLVEAGLRHIVLCTGYQGDQIPPVIGGEYHGASVEYSQEPEPRGTAGAIRLAWSRVSSESGLVLNGDSYCDADLGRFWQWHRARGGAASLLLSYTTDTRRFGRVTSADDGRIRGFEEKGAASGPGWINAGIYLFSRAAVERIPTGRAVSLEREMFPAWIAQGLWGYRGPGRVLDIGTPESYAASQLAFPTVAGSARTPIKSRGGL
jgi:NDP-sugar pyrophosphorylase family protein